MKILHLHLLDGWKNKSTLICRLENGSINYSFFQGHSSAGTRFSLSNLNCTLPIDKLYKNESLNFFKRRIKETIEKKSTYTIFNEVNNNIKF